MMQSGSNNFLLSYSTYFVPEFVFLLPIMSLVWALNNIDIPMRFLQQTSLNLLLKLH